MSYTSPRLGRKWLLVAEGPAPYRTTRRKLAILRTGLGDTNGASYTLHSRKNPFSTAANQMSFDRREMTIIGHWSSTTRMPERYDRIVCASELLLRNARVQRIGAGWGVAPAHRLPATVDGRLRIGKPVSPDTPDDKDTAKQCNEQGIECALPTDGELGCNGRPIDKVDGRSHDGARGEVEGTQSTGSGTLELIPTQTDTRTEPKNDVLALGTQALGNPNF